MASFTISYLPFKKDGTGCREAVAELKRLEERAREIGATTHPFSISEKKLVDFAKGYSPHDTCYLRLYGNLTKGGHVYWEWCYAEAFVSNYGQADVDAHLYTGRYRDKRLLLVT